MTTTGELATFSRSVKYDSLPADVVDELKRRVLDSIGIAVGARNAAPINGIRATVERFNTGSSCRLWCSDDRASPVGAAMVNTALTRQLDFMDSFLAPGETPHPSDNIASIVAVAEEGQRSGRDLLAAAAVAYEVQGELAWNAPVRDRGWDHVTHTVISATCGVGAVAELDHEALRNAIGIAGTAHNALRVTRTGGINQWKGIASANAARNAVYAVGLAEEGIEGPVDLFEGQKGWKQVIAGDFSMDLDPSCSRVHDVMTKRYVAETYAQSAVEGIIELAEENDVDTDRIESIHLDTFAGAKLIIGGGEGSRYEVSTKAQADHSLPYMLAVSLIDREMSDRQYDRERIVAGDVQRLLRRVSVEEDQAFTERFENGEMPARITVTMDDGRTHEVEKSNFVGHPDNPMGWDDLERKFISQVRDRYRQDQIEEVIDVVRNLESHDVSDLVNLLE